MKEKRTFLENTIMLTAVTLFLRAVSVSFQIYIGNRLGAGGMGLFSLIMSVYHFGVTFACSGISLATTRIVSEELARGQEGGMKKAVRISVYYGLFFGVLASVLIFFAAPFFGNTVLKDARCILPLQILSLSLPFVALSSAANGYFTAAGSVRKGAKAQVLEQLLRVAGGLLLLSFSGKDEATACCAVVASGCVAEFISFLYAMLLWKKDIKKYKGKRAGESVTRRVLSVGIPIAVSSYVRSGLNTVEHTMIPKGLKKYGGNYHEALSAYGVVHGMVMPLIFFPASVLSAVSILLVPEITKLCAGQNEKNLNRFIEKSLSATFLFSIGAAGILYFFAEEIGMTLYNSREVSRLLKLLAPLAAVMYTDDVIDAVLKGFNQQVYSMAYNIFDSALAIVLMMFLLPKQGLYGYLLILYITEMVNAFFSMNRLLKVSTFRIRPLLWTVPPALFVCVVSVFVRSIQVLDSVWGILCAVVLYGAAAFLFCPKYAVAKNTRL